MYVVDQETTPSDSITDLVTKLPAVDNETSAKPPTSRYPKRVTKPPDHYTSGGGDVEFDRLN